MKKLLKVFIVLLLAFSVVGCGDKKVEDNTAKEANVEEEFYRNIIIDSFEGEVSVKHANGEALSAYEGMSLKNGDAVKVSENSTLTLKVDSDKVLYAEENTSFTLSASGTEESNNTQILLDDGSVLCQIKEKLKEDESFDIVTASSTMCVRGTVFRVSLIESSDTNNYEMVEVYDGKVWSNIQEKNDELILEPGQCALIKEDANGNNANYVTSDQIDADFWASDDTNMFVTKEEGEGSKVLEIAYNKLSEKTIDNLTEVAESGQEIILPKEILFDLSEFKKSDGSSNVNREPVVESYETTSEYTRADGTSYNVTWKTTKTISYDDNGLPRISVNIETGVPLDAFNKKVDTDSTLEDDKGQQGEEQKPEQKVINDDPGVMSGEIKHEEEQPKTDDASKPEGSNEGPAIEERKVEIIIN